MDYTGYWIFYCNPRLWEIDDYLDIGEIYSTWTITDWQKDFFRKGDKGIIRVGEDKRTKAQLNGKQRLESGIYAIVEIVSAADFIMDSDGKHWLDPNRTDEKRLRVRIKILNNLLAKPIYKRDLMHYTETSLDDALISGRQNSSWALSKKAYDKIIELTNFNYNEIEKVKEETFDNLRELKLLELKYSNATPRLKEIISKKIERGEISRIVKKINNFECQVCKVLGLNPAGFLKINGEPYIETHHIIPVSEMEQGSLGVLNLITLCPNHHRQMHYGNVRLIDNNSDVFKFEIDKKEITINKITGC